MLTYYELDLGLNHVVRKWSEPTDPRANLLVQVPGGQLASSDRFDGPSGVLVCCEDHIIYRNMDAPQHRVPIPRRRHPLDDPDRGLIIVAAVMHKMKVNSSSRGTSNIDERRPGCILLLATERGR
jgi:splicing factor 3B subunit 3